MGELRAAPHKINQNLRVRVVEDRVRQGQPKSSKQMTRLEPKDLKGVGGRCGREVVHGSCCAPTIAIGRTLSKEALKRAISVDLSWGPIPARPDRGKTAGARRRGGHSGHSSHSVSGADCLLIRSPQCQSVQVL